MPCIGPACNNELEFQITTHGETIGACAQHIKSARKAANLSENDAVNDYVKLYALMSSNELFKKVMKKFTIEVSRAEKKRQGKSAWFNRDKIAIKLNYSLSRYEGLCWFGTQPKIMSGLLSAQEFKDAIVQGYMVKDPGPGADHGEYSHRLQWHYIMRVMTNGFQTEKTSDWSMTPLELYSGTMSNFDTGTGDGNLWGKLLEGNTATFMTGTAGDPSWVNRQFREDVDLKASSFGVTLNKRYNRRLAMEQTVSHMLSESGYAVDEIPTGRLQTGKDLKLHGVLEYLYKWKKVGGEGASHVQPNWMGKESKELEAAKLLWGSHFGAKYARGRHAFKRAAHTDPDDETMLVVSDGLLMHGSESAKEDDVGNRIAASKGGLNPAFKYSSSVGAQRRAVRRS